MHFYMFNPADFNNSARHLTLPERAIYRDLIDMYYNTEQAIDASDMDSLARRLLCTTPEYRASLEYILAEYFTKRGKRHHHHRIDKEIKNYKHANSNGKRNADGNAVTLPVTQGVTLGNAPCNVIGNDGCNVDDIPMTNAERTRKSRQDKRNMIDSLISAGVSVDKDIKAADLKALYAANIDVVTRNNELNVMQAVTPSNDPCNAGNAKNAAITSNYELETNNQLNNLNNNAAVTESFDVEFWQPTLTAVQSVISSEAPAMPVMSQSDFDIHLAKFRNYRIEEKVKGDPVATEARCLDMFVDWIKREYIYQQKSKATAANPVSSKKIVTVDYSTIGKSPVTQDGDLPAVFNNPSHSSPVAPAKRDLKTSIMVNGLFRAPFPNMSCDESYEHIRHQKMPGEMADETYDRLLNQMEKAV